MPRVRCEAVAKHGTLAERLRGFVRHLVVLHGGMTAAQRRERIANRIEVLKAKGVTAFLKTVAEEEGINKSRVQQILKGRPESEDAKKSSPVRKGTISRRN